MLELCHELRSPFVNWVVRNQVSVIQFIFYLFVYLFEFKGGEHPPILGGENSFCGH